MPVAPAEAATSGGGTRRGSSATTRRCASGRYTRSQTSSRATLFFRERSSALDKCRLVDRRAGGDQLAPAVDVIPHVPVEESARSTRPVDVRDDPLAIRLLPALHSLEP